MRVVIQRVSEASVTIGGVVRSKIGQGLLVLLVWDVLVALFMITFQKLTN